MRDMRQRLDEQWRVRAHQRRAQDRSVPCARANDERVALQRDGVQLGDAIDVDQQPGLRHAQGQHRHQTLAARENRRRAAMLRQQSKRFG